ncbi:MAG: DinB family protein [Acidimicrobiia bacterium]
MAACPVCGVDEAALSVADATDAIRTFPRRYREALADVPDELLRKRPDPGTWSMLEYAVHVREVIELFTGSLPVVLGSPAPAFPPIDVDDVSASRPEWVVDVDLALGGIAASCRDLVEQIEVVPLAAWDRSFTVGDDVHTARWIPRHVAHEGVHHLRDIARVRAVVEGGAAS